MTKNSARTKSKGIIVFDLDGTLVDHWLRMYELYRRYMTRYGKNPAVLGQYRAWKISGENEKTIAKRLISGTVLEKYLSWKFRHIEDQKLLSLDRLLPGTKSVLEKLSHDWTMVVLTSRQHQIRTCRQLDTLGIRKYFIRVIVAPGTDYVEGKYVRILQYLKSKEYVSGNRVVTDNTAGYVVFVGDTEREIEIAHRLGAASVAVATGVRGLSFLKRDNPDLTLQSLDLLPLAINEIVC